MFAAIKRVPRLSVFIDLKTSLNHDTKTLGESLSIQANHSDSFLGDPMLFWIPL